MSDTDQTTAEQNSQISPETQPDDQFKKERNKLRIIVVLLLIVIILLLIRESWIHASSDAVVLEPDYPLIEEEENAEPTGDDQEKLEADVTGGAVALSYSDQVTYDMAKDMVYLDFTNPGSSTQSMIMQVILYGKKNEETGKTDEYLLAESGVLKPGNRVEKLNSDKDEQVKLSQGNYSGVIRLLFYNPETGEKAIVNTEIPVEIAVQ